MSSSEPRKQWNRYDAAGQRTVYAASTVEGAYGEILAKFKPQLQMPATKYFDDVAPNVDLEQLIREEWVDAGYSEPRKLDLAWLQEHRLYEVTLPTAGWFIDIEASSSLTSIIRHAPASLVESGYTEITVAELRGSDRWLTTEIASRLWQLTLEDGSLAHGILSGSRHGSDWSCWAIWLRRDPSSSAAELVPVADRGSKILPPDRNPPLATVLKTYDLTYP